MPSSWAASSTLHVSDVMFDVIGSPLRSGTPVESRLVTRPLRTGLNLARNSVFEELAHDVGRLPVPFRVERGVDVEGHIRVPVAQPSGHGADVDTLAQQTGGNEMA